MKKSFWRDDIYKYYGYGHRLSWCPSRFSSVFPETYWNISSNYATNFPSTHISNHLLTIILPFEDAVSRDSAVGIATGYGLDDWEFGVRVPVGSRIFTSPCRPDRFCGPPNLLYNGYRDLFPGGKAAGAWSWPLTLQLVPRSRKCGSIHPLPHTPSWRSA
jgi:hypothetical protein